MRSISFHTRRTMNTALAVLVAAALSHCSWQESRELAQWSGTIAQHRLALPSPIQAPVHDCDHEYGCICRGATIVQAVDASLDQTVTVEILPAHLALDDGLVIADGAAVAAWSSALEHESSLPPISGRQLRALHASLVL